MPVDEALYSSGQVGNVITNRNASRLEFERLLVSDEAVMRLAFSSPRRLIVG